METDSSSKQKPRRRGGCLRPLALLTLLVAAVIALAVNHVATHLREIAEWALEEVLPGAIVRIETFDLTAPTQLTVTGLEISSRESGERLLSLAGGTVEFTINDLRQGQVGEIRLIQPVIDVSPKLFAALARAPTSPSAASPTPWIIRRLVCDYGEIRVNGYGPGDLALNAKFTADISPFAPVSQPSDLYDVVLWDVAASVANTPVATADLLRLSASADGITRDRRIESISIEGGSLLIGTALQSLFAPSPSPSPKTDRPWTIGKFTLSQIDVRLDDDRPGVSDIRFSLNTTFTNITLSQALADVGTEVQLIEVSDLEVLSPLDPFAKVLTLRNVFIRFTLAGLLEQRLKEVVILHPTVWVGPDLFWYMDDMQKRTSGNGQGGAWKIDRVDIKFGRLVLGGAGRREYGLPLNFQTEVTDVALDNLAALKMQAVLEIPAQKYRFDSYQIEFESERGELRFAYPPEKGENNLVGTIRITTMNWRQYKASDAWLTVTFDKQGINGEFGGKVYRGYASGGFSFLFEPASPWIGWIAGKRVNLRDLTNILSPQNIRLTGPLDFTLQLDAFGRSIERVVGDFRTTQPGRMVITKLDDLLARIPDTWNALKQSSTRIALEALRDFDYTSARGDFWFVRGQGILDMALKGPTGSRKFEIVLHADDTPEGKWKSPASP